MEETNFTDLGLNKYILQTLLDIGYEVPTPIQIQAIPSILVNYDILGVAQTGTGKTAAFALPILSRINLAQKDPQVLVLTPTRELAIQVAEAFVSFSRNIKGLNVLPIYGGSDYVVQIKSLKRGVHVVVGTPGRIMDHIKKGTLKLNKITNLVLDEADEMLQMGFIDDVEWILKHTPNDHQISLFSATMPKEIHRIAKTYLNKPKEIIIKQKTATAPNIEQKYWLVSGLHKLDALTRILEAETFDAMIIFNRTKTGTIELAEKLSARGYSVAALNGDIAQNNREKIIKQLKAKKIDILVATDVAARGLDVSRISHIINYDIPHDTESYVHRIGRTGRAGRSGAAILFVSPREKRLLRAIERATNNTITRMLLPSVQEINDKRITRFKDKIVNATQNGDLTIFQKMIENIEIENNIPAIELAAGLAKLLQGDSAFFLPNKPIKDIKSNKGSKQIKTKAGMVRFRLAIGKKDGVKANNIIGCIANEAGLESQHIQNLSIEDNFSFVDLPDYISDSIFNELKNAWVCGKRLDISRLSKHHKHKASFKRNALKKPRRQTRKKAKSNL